MQDNKGATYPVYVFISEIPLNTNIISYIFSQLET